jgi:hypothetical protein
MRLGELLVSGAVEQHREDDLRALWADLYGPQIAGQLRPDHRYSLIKVGAAEFAYSDYGTYLRALGQAWDAGFVPDPLPSALGRELPEMAPNLKGLDTDLSDFEPGDFEPPARRFSKPDA